MVALCIFKGSGNLAAKELSTWDYLTQMGRRSFQEPAPERSSLVTGTAEEAVHTSESSYRKATRLQFSNNNDKNHAAATKQTGAVGQVLEGSKFLNTQ